MLTDELEKIDFKDSSCDKMNSIEVPGTTRKSIICIEDGYTVSLIVIPDFERLIPRGRNNPFTVSADRTTCHLISMADQSEPLGSRVCVPKRLLLEIPTA